MSRRIGSQVRSINESESHERGGSPGSHRPSTPRAVRRRCIPLWSRSRLITAAKPGCRERVAFRPRRIATSLRPLRQSRPVERRRRGTNATARRSPEHHHLPSLQHYDAAVFRPDVRRRPAKQSNFRLVPGYVTSTRPRRKGQCDRRSAHRHSSAPGLRISRQRRESACYHPSDLFVPGLQQQQ